MTIVIGLAEGQRGTAAIRLGSMLATARGEDLVVAAVTPVPWPVNPIDEEFVNAQDKAARRMLDSARSALGDGISARYVVQPAQSVATGLLEVVQAEKASLIVLGSTARGPMGSVSLGSVAERILHSTDTPICFAPLGYRGTTRTRLTRLTVGFGRADHDSGLLATVADTAKDLGVRLRVACFAVRPSGAQGWSIEDSAEDLVVGEWVDAVRADIAKSLESADVDPVRVDTVIGPGPTWGDAVRALPWKSGDLLVIGASSSAVSRFLLGSHASKIVRSSPVPVMIVPRS